MGVAAASAIPDSMALFKPNRCELKGERRLSVIALINRQDGRERTMVDWICTKGFYIDYSSSKPHFQTAFTNEYFKP
jgi:hypothetical protein